MQFGRLNFARSGSLFARAVLPIFSLAIMSVAQPAPSASAQSPPVQSSEPSSEPSGAASSGAKTVSATALGNSPDRPASTKPEASAPAELEKGPHASSTSLRLGAGDLLEISVYNVPELNTKARVGNSGDVYLPLVDYVHVAGLTVEEAQALIEKRLVDGGFVRNAHVTVFLDESANQGVTVLGEVGRPGVYPLLGDRRLYDMISAAGGFAQAAGRNVSVIRQGDPSSPITVNLPRNLADDLQDNIEIFPGDTITVPKAPIVYVVGDVGHPAGLLVDNGSLTVLQALALAGGTNHTAKLHGVSIIRKGPNGMMETRVPLKKMLEAKAPDIPLQADDILFVPLSGVRVAAGEGMSAAISAATGLAIIAAH